MDFNNTIVCGDNVETLKQVDDNSVDLVVTSPPYDELRDYEGYSLDLHGLGTELYRVMKDGGVVAVVINDMTKDFKKSLTTWRLVVDWVDNIGFALSECVIYKRHGIPGLWAGRFRVDHEYIPIFFKGKRPKYVNKEHLKIPTLHTGKKWGGSKRQKDGTTTAYTELKEVQPLKDRGTVWEYATSNSEGNKLKLRHPATFPDKLAEDLILCYSQEGELVLDPFMGSGTTPVMAAKNNRNYFGIDVGAEYCELAHQRLSNEIKLLSKAA